MVVTAVVVIVTAADAAAGNPSFLLSNKDHIQTGASSKAGTSFFVSNSNFILKFIDD